MAEWLVPAGVIVGFLVIAVWGMVLGGFVPHRQAGGQVLAIDEKTRFALVLYRLDGRTYQAFSVLPDRSGLESGDTVSIIAGRNRRQCWIKRRAGV